MNLSLKPSDLRFTHTAWTPLPDYQLMAAEHVLDPMQGVAVIVPHKPHEHGTIILPDIQHSFNKHSHRKVEMSWRDQTAGTVVAVGRDVESPALLSSMVGKPWHQAIQAGDRVLFKRHKCTEFQNFASKSGDWAFSADQVCFAGRFLQSGDSENSIDIRLIPKVRPLHQIIMATIHTNPDNTIPTDIPFLKPYGNQVLILRDEIKEKTSSGLFTGRTIRKTNIFGEEEVSFESEEFRKADGIVIAKGHLCSDDVKIGSRALYQFEGQEIVHLADSMFSPRVVLVAESRILSFYGEPVDDVNALWKSAHEKS
jgi:co-chaperonin GroES (HSP10)